MLIIRQERGAKRVEVFARSESGRTRREIRFRDQNNAFPSLVLHPQLLPELKLSDGTRTPAVHTSTLPLPLIAGVSANQTLWSGKQNRQRHGTGGWRGVV